VVSAQRLFKGCKERHVEPATCTCKPLEGGGPRLQVRALLRAGGRSRRAGTHARTYKHTYVSTHPLKCQRTAFEK
jgi:hypothetical protein